MRKFDFWFYLITILSVFGGTVLYFYMLPAA